MHSSLWLQYSLNNKTLTNFFVLLTYAYSLADTTDYKVARVPQCLSLRPNWDPPPPLPQGSVPPPKNQMGGEGPHRDSWWTLACVRGSGEPNSDDDRKSLALLPILCHEPFGVAWPVAFSFFRGEDETARAVHQVGLAPLAEVEGDAHLGVWVGEVSVCPAQEIHIFSDGSKCRRCSGNFLLH